MNFFQHVSKKKCPTSSHFNRVSGVQKIKEKAHSLSPWCKHRIMVLLGPAKPASTRIWHMEHPHSKISGLKTVTLLPSQPPLHLLNLLYLKKDSHLFGSTILWKRRAKGWLRGGVWTRNSIVCGLSSSTLKWCCRDNLFPLLPSPRASFKKYSYFCCWPLKVRLYISSFK